MVSLSDVGRPDRRVLASHCGSHSISLTANDVSTFSHAYLPSCMFFGEVQKQGRCLLHEKLPLRNVGLLSFDGFENPLM